MAVKSVWKMILVKTRQETAYTLWLKYFIEIVLSLSLRSQDKCIFALYTEIQDGRQK